MIIAVSGLTGSGKNTFGELLARRLGHRIVSPTFKDLAKKAGVPLLEFQKRAESDHSIDQKFDAFLKQEAGKGDCVVTTWLGPWMLAADFRIHIFAPERTRAERVADRDSMPLRQALAHIRERDSNNIRRYKDIYRIDITDTSTFDLALSSESYAPGQMVEIALVAIRKKFEEI
ncbi:MAG TPA: cytidylate kinase family protein [Candidatus Bilamarchaeaceae archaeon]|nr:cytidylate kinase family protein [Candidatus Bilamarchaeaceae archaeon]